LTEENEKKWYAIHVLSGHEGKVKTFLENEVKNLHLEERIDKVMIPSEQVTEMKEGKRRSRTKTLFPGYMLVYMALDKETRHVVLNTPSVTNFVGPKNEPLPLQPGEVERLLGRIGDKEKQSAPFRVGDPIKVIDGPFTEFTGFVEEVNDEKNKLKVLVSIFGRSTPVELDFLQVELEK